MARVNFDSIRDLPAFASFSRDFGWIVLVNQEMQPTVDSAAVVQDLQLAPDGGQAQVIDAAVDLAAANQVNTQDLTLQRRNDFEIRNVGQGDWPVHRISRLRLVSRERCQGPRRTQQCPKRRRQTFLRTDSWPQHTPGGGRSDRRHRSNGNARDGMETTGGQYHHVSNGDFDGLFEINRAIGRGGDQARLVLSGKALGHPQSSLQLSRFSLVVYVTRQTTRNTVATTSGNCYSAFQAFFIRNTTITRQARLSDEL